MHKFSSEYHKLIKEYKYLHENGVGNITPQSTFVGGSLLKWATDINHLIKKKQISSLIDFGCGKAYYYENQIKITNKQIKKKLVYDNLLSYWGINDCTLYDPGVKKYSKYPVKKKDLVICTDVLEHIPPEDTYNFIKDIFSLTNKLVFFVVHTKPSNKKLSNGKNVHTNLKTIEDWGKIFKSIHNEFRNIEVELKFGDC